MRKTFLILLLVFMFCFPLFYAVGQQGKYWPAVAGGLYMDAVTLILLLIFKPKL